METTAATMLEAVRRWTRTAGGSNRSAADTADASVKASILSEKTLRPQGENEEENEVPGKDPEAGIVSHLQPIGDYGPIRDFVLDPAYPGKMEATAAQ